MYAYIGIPLFILLLISFYFIRKAMKLKYTKSRFAFVSLSSLLTVILLIIATLSSGQTPLQVGQEVIYNIIGLEYVTSGPNMFEVAILCLLTWFIYSFCTTTFKNWDGPITESQYRKRIRKEEEGLLVDGYEELINLLKGGIKEELHISKKDRKIDIKLKTPVDSLSWHMQACELISLVNSDLFIEPECGCVDKERLWIGEYKTTKQKVFLYCSLTILNDDDINSIIEKFKKYMLQDNSVDSNIIFIIAIKEGCENKSINVNGFNVEIYSEDILLNKLIYFEDYFYEIRRRVEKETLTESSLTILDTYVKANYTIEGDKTEHEDIENYLLDWLSDTSRRQVALLGEYGQGKSTLSLIFAYNIIKKKYLDIKYIPIIIELRGKSPATMTPDEVLSSWSTNYQIKSSALKKLLISGRVLLILEGFDEMAFLGDSETRINHFKTLWLLNYPKAKILITGRPNFFLDDNEMKNALGVLEPVPGKTYCEAVHIAPFSKDKIFSSLRKFPSKTKSEIIKLLKNDPNFKDLASRPSLLYLIAVLWEKKNLSQYSGNINSALIMGLFISYSYSRQHLKEEESTTFMFLSENERSYFMSGVAVFMSNQLLPNQIKGITLRELVPKLFEIMPDSVSLSNSAIDGCSRTALNSRINNEEDKIEQLQTDIRSCGLLVRDIASTGAFKFSHKSFLEYLSAEVLAKYLDDEDESFSIISGLNINIYNILISEEILSFFAELLKNKFNDKKKYKNNLAEYLLNIISKKDTKKIKFMYQMESNINLSESKFIKIYYQLRRNTMMAFPTNRSLFIKRFLWEACCCKLNIPISEMVNVSRGCEKSIETRRNIIFNKNKIFDIALHDTTIYSFLNSMLFHELNIQERGFLSEIGKNKRL